MRYSTFLRLGSKATMVMKKKVMMYEGEGR